MKQRQLSSYALLGSMVALACGDRSIYPVGDIHSGGRNGTPSADSSVAGANPTGATPAGGVGPLSTTAAQGGMTWTVAPASAGTIASGTTAFPHPTPNTGVGGAPTTSIALSNTLLPMGGAALGGSPSGPQECPNLGMPYEPTRPGYVPTADLDQKVAELLGTMTLDAKIKQMYGLETPDTRAAAVYRDIMRSGDVDSTRGKIRGFKFRNANRGVTLADGQIDRLSESKDYSTAFPATSVRAASWDVELEMQLGEAIGDETMASKNNVVVAPSAAVVRHPYWGRTQDAYGEDAHLIGRMASAFVAGAQQHVVACAIHFAANSSEYARWVQNAVLDEQTLREIYTASYEMVVRDGGVGCVMAAYNSVNGTKSTQNKHLLTDLLRGSMGFRGFVLSDWWAMPGDQTPPDTVTAQANAREAVMAGLDVEMPWSINFSELQSLVDSGSLTQSDIDRAAGRILEQKLRFNTMYTSSPFGLGTSETKLDGDSITNNETHLQLSEEAETRSAVLLANGPNTARVLPIRTASSIAVVGMDMDMMPYISDQTDFPTTGPIMHYATDVNLGDRGSYRINPAPATSVGPYAGIKEIAAKHGITNVTSGNSIEAAKNADFVVVVVGLSAGDEGEEYTLLNRLDRTSLNLPGDQNAFISNILNLNKPTAIIIESGSIVNVPWLSHANQKQATIWAGYGGQRVGLALGKLLLGDRNFSGKMPLAWPKQEDLPEFRTVGATKDMELDYFHGYRYYDISGKSPNLVFPFGHGLSYTTFKYENLQSQYACSTVRKSTEAIAFTVDVTNTGTVDGDEVIMLFVSGPPKSSTITGKRPVKELKRFHRVSLKAGVGNRVTLPLRIQDLRHWEGDANGRWVVDEGEYKVMVGPNAANLQLVTSFNLVP